MSIPTQSLQQYLEQRFTREIKAHRVLEPIPAAQESFPEGLPASLREILQAQGIHALYSHQQDAFAAIGNGQDTVLVSQTASGKTLAFLLPMLSQYVQQPSAFSVLLLYPTKALSRDQESTLGKLLKAAVGERKLGTFDGDTPQDDRRNIQRVADFVITNPDMLHAGILPNHHRGWRSFLSRLRFIVVDEIHTYRGAFGSHVSNVFRRLLRVCEMHGSRPQIICSSATVGNPGELAQGLFHRPFTVLSRNGAPRPRRDLYLVNPPVAQTLGAAWYRKGPSAISVPLIRQAVERGVRTICFCRARQEVERLCRAVWDRHPELCERVKPYRGGLLPNERRQLEKDLFEGRLNAIVTTNALELGIDIGNLDFCILSGFPGSLASFWQQAGRVGRKGAHALIAFIARDAPVDQFLVNHPDFLLEAPIERAWLNADNPYILLQHLPCAAYEHPLRATEPLFSGPAYGAAVEVLRAHATVVPYHDCWRYALSDYPAKGVNLRGLTDYNIQIACGTEIIGELDPIGARGTLYKDAIYQHLGRRYMSLDLDLPKKLCHVAETQVDYFTEAVWEKRIELTAVEEEKTLAQAALQFGPVHVNKQPKLYKKIRERSFENIGYGPITLDAFEYDTTGFSLLPPRAWQQAMDAADKRFLGAAMFGLSYLLHHAAPCLCMADVNDIETDVSLHEEEAQRWKSSLYLYDAIEGGAGYAEKIYELLPEALRLCRSIIAGCECPAGCPSCVPPLPPGITDETLEDFLIESDAAVTCTESLLAALLDERIELPQVQVRQLARQAAVSPEPEDAESIKLKQRLQRAATMLKSKRAKEH